MKVTKTYFMLMVDDMDRATTFYRDVFGLSARFVSPEWSELAWGDAIVAFHGGRGGAEHRPTGLGFEVDDLEEACAAVEEGGGTVVMPPSDRPAEPMRLADVADPEGNVVNIAQSIWGPSMRHHTQSGRAGVTRVTAYTPSMVNWRVLETRTT